MRLFEAVREVLVVVNRHRASVLLEDLCTLLEKLEAGRDLARAEAESVMEELLSGRMAHADVVRLLLAMRNHVQLPDRDLAYFSQGSAWFDDYVEAVGWAQDYALLNRREMMRLVLHVLERELPSAISPWKIEREAINCHHNYVAQETHFGERLFVTRKGAISAREGEMGIIPGSMGARSYIVRGLGNPQSLCSCSHGAGRRMSRTAAKRQFTRSDLEEQTRGVECRKDGGVIDEIPGAYKNIDTVMENQRDLVEVVHTLKQVICVKG